MSDQSKNVGKKGFDIIEVFLPVKELNDGPRLGYDYNKEFFVYYFQTNQAIENSKKCE
jgi:hypothetical protein